MLSPRLEQSLYRSLGIANQHRHEQATLEHLLLALTDDGDAAVFFEKRDVDVQLLRKKLLEYLSQLPSIGRGDARPNNAFQRSLQRAAVQVQARGESMVNGAHVAEAMQREHMSFVDAGKVGPEHELEKE